MFIIKKSKSFREKLKEKGLAKLILPKIAKIGVNLAQLGPRVIMRSAIKLIRVNPITRFVSVASLVVVDVWLLIRKKISKTQFVINLIYSASMFIGSTVGWYTGQGIAEQLLLDFLLGLVISIVFTFIGIQLFDRLVKLFVPKLFKSDCEKGIEIANEIYKEDRDIFITREQAIEIYRLYPAKHEEYIDDLIITYVE